MTPTVETKEAIGAPVGESGGAVRPADGLTSSPEQNLAGLPTGIVGVRVTLLPMSSAPRDGTEILAWSEAGNFHQVFWKDHERYKWRPYFPPRWGMRWTDDYCQADGQFEGWIPMPVRSCGTDASVSLGDEDQPIDGAK